MRKKVGSLSWLFRALVGGLLGLSLAGCLSTPPRESAQAMAKADILNFNRQQSKDTDPGKYGALYQGLPTTYAELCQVIKAQLVHPWADLPALRDLIPANRSNEDFRYPTVRSMLTALTAYNPQGLVPERAPAERLIVTCRYHAILLASILRSQGVPTRVRYGFANYLIPNKFISHVICEAWDAEQGRWILIDPDRQRVDVSPEDYMSGGQAWLAFRSGKLDAKLCGVDQYWGVCQIVSMLCADLRSVQGNVQHLYWEYPPLMTSPHMEAKDIPVDRAQTLDRAAELLLDPDDNWDSLQALYRSARYLRF